MIKASISTLKSKLGDYVKLVRKGEEVLITDRGLPVARLVPLDSTNWVNAHMKDLIARGLAKPPVAKQLPKDIWERPRLVRARSTPAERLPRWSGGTPGAGHA